MSVALIVAARTLPLYGLIVLGYLLGRNRTGVREILAELLIYYVSPVVVMHGILHSDFGSSSLLLAPLFFAISCAISTVVYRVAGRFWQDSTHNILAFTAGTGNTGYFGLPVAIVLFGERAVAPAVIAGLGVVLYENSLGYYYTARGSFSAKESLHLILRLPTLYAVVITSLMKFVFHAEPNAYIDEVTSKFIGTYSVLGMMLIGVGLSQLRGFAVDRRFLLACIGIKFLLWPLIVLSLIGADSWLFGIFDPLEKRVMALLAFVPLAALTVAFAAKLDAQPEKAALAVLVTTVMSMAVIPLVAVFLAAPM